ncbi:MAG TPA: glycosyltransferase [Gemmobacter sp.]|nr:glycosyltransferase [Gemmobacter sp.]
MTLRAKAINLFLCHTAYEVGGAKVVTDRNLDFWRRAAHRRGRDVIEIVPQPREGLHDGLRGRLTYLLFRVSPHELSQVMGYARAGADVWIDHGGLGAVAALLRLLRVPGRIFLFHHNDETRYAQDEYRAAGLRSWRLRAKVALVWMRQKLGLMAAHRHVFISPTERARHPQRVGMVLPPSWPAIVESPALHEGFVLLVGSRFFANLHGFRWYLDQVAPQIPTSSVIVGRGMDAAFQSGGGVTVQGFVPDLSQLYAKARMVAVPIFKGAGTKVKLAEALHHGCQVVATPEACEGIEGLADFLASGQLICAQGADFAQAIRAEIAAHPDGRRFAPNGFCHERFEETFLAFCAPGDLSQPG